MKPLSIIDLLNLMLQCLEKALHNSVLIVVTHQRHADLKGLVRSFQGGLTAVGQVTIIGLNGDKGPVCLF